MTLNGRQIERYSRQIIAIGGIAQERLLAARITIVGEVADIEPVIEYLVGAGVGRVNLRLVGGAEASERLLARARGVNPAVVVEAKNSNDGSSGRVLLILAGSAATLTLAGSLFAEPANAPTVFARLDSPARVVTIPNPSPYTTSAAANLFAPISTPSKAAGIVAMVAAVEALKLMYADSPELRPSTIEFASFESANRSAAP